MMQIVPQTAKHLTPAGYVIHLFGGVGATARAIGRTSGSVSLWDKPRKREGRHGRGGAVPQLLHQHVLRVAADRGFDLSAEDLIHGRDIDEVAG